MYLSSAPDGTLYIVNLYHGIIQDKGYITEYLRDQILSRDLEAPIHFGRIWRVVHDQTTRGPAPALSGASPSQLVALLSHPNGWWRDTAQRLLVERDAVSEAPALASLAANAKDPRTRLHALWTLDGIDTITPAEVERALTDASRDVRVAAVRLSERWLPDAGSPVAAAVVKRINDPDWNVQEQLAASLGALPPGRREAALVQLLDKHGDNPVVMDAALSGVRGRESALLQQLLTNTGDTPQREAALSMVVATILHAGQDAAIQQVLLSVADRTKPAWQRAALMSGTEVAVLGAAMPGTAGRGRRGGAPNAAPCPTCPGGRSGPGGAPAFPTPPPATAAAGRTGAAPAAGGRGRGRGRGGPMLRLGHEPKEFAALAGGTGDLATRAARVLDRLEWPGKPGAEAPIPPLTPVEQQRFEVGREVYQNICQACHQPDGRGQDKIAANLIGSPLALGRPDVTARILLNGKEGPIGLMPPIGAALTDDQIAGVLTYIRREWGQTGTPVDPATVKQVRALTASRTRPWTNDELNALLASH